MLFFKEMFYRSVLNHRQFRYLGSFYLHSLIRLFAISLFQIFSSVYVYQSLQGFGMNNNQALGITALLFALIFVVQALSVPISLWLISRRGLRFSVFWGNIFLVGFFALLYLGKYDAIFLVIASVLGGVQIALYWTAYHIYLAELTDDKKQGEEIAVGNSLSALAAIGGPAFGGLIIYYFGFGAIFIIMGILVGLANFPLRYLPNRRNTISVDIIRTITVLAPKTEQKSYIALLGAGIIDLIAGSFWPLFIFPVMAGFVGLGFVGSLIALISTVTTIIIGVLIDRYGPRRVINILSPLDSILWALRIFVDTPLRVFTASAGQAFSTSGQIISLDSMIYERARHDNVVAFIIQREMGLALGKFIFLLFIGTLFWFGTPLAVVFIFAAIGALLVRFYPAENLEIEKKITPLKLPRFLTTVLNRRSN